MNDMGKNLLLWLIIAAVLLMVFNKFNVTQGPEEVTYSDFLEMVTQNQVRNVDIEGLVIRGERFDGERFEAIQPQVVDKALIDEMVEHNVDFRGARPETQSNNSLPQFQNGFRVRCETFGFSNFACQIKQARRRLRSRTTNASGQLMIFFC